MSKEEDGIILLILKIPNYTKLLFALYKDKDIAPKHKAVLSAGIAYSVSPVDLVPGIIPVAGQLDNIIIMLWSLKKVLSGVSEDIRERHLKNAGITMADIETDSKVAKKTLKAIGKGTVRLVRNSAKIAGYTALDIGRKLFRKKGFY